MARADKVAAVAELAENFRSSDGAMLTEYRGLTVPEAFIHILPAEYLQPGLRLAAALEGAQIVRFGAGGSEVCTA